MVLFLLTIANIWLSGEKVVAQATPKLNSNNSTCTPESTFHYLIVLSLEMDIKIVPSGVKITYYIASECPFSSNFS